MQELGRDVGWKGEQRWEVGMAKGRDSYSSTTCFSVYVILDCSIASLLPPSRLYGKEEGKQLSTTAGVEGKTKEVLESVGLTLLCLAFRADSSMNSYSMLLVIRGCIDILCNKICKKGPSPTFPIFDDF